LRSAPPNRARYVAPWAVRAPGHDVPEPSCGEAAFRLAAGEPVAALAGATGGRPLLAGADKPVSNDGEDHSDGVKLHTPAARAVLSRWVRSPRWPVLLPRPADLLPTYMNIDTPRLARTSGAATT